MPPKRKPVKTDSGEASAEPLPKKGKQSKKKTEEDGEEENEETGGGGEKKKSGWAKTPIADVTKLDLSSEAKTKDGKKWNMKFTSWNVNGIRAWMEKNCHSYVKHENPDIFCVQETKCPKDHIPDEVKVDGYHTYWLSGDKDGYSGVGLYSKLEPLAVTFGLGIEKHDKEGRVITAEYNKFYFVTTYIPNSGRGLPRLDYRTKEWDVDFRDYLKKLDAKKPVILCGDLNVAHRSIDLSNPKGNTKTAGFTTEERESFSKLLSEGFIDSFRHLYPDVEGAYSYWTYMMNARAKNAGWRLDYFVLSERLKTNLCDSVIRKDVMGSDHCPITLLMNF